MPRLRILALFIVLCSACSSKKGPDVSNIPVSLELQRFEKDFFAIDTNNINASLDQLSNKYPGFLQDFVFNILALPQQQDSTGAMSREINSFLQSYAPVKDTVSVVFSDFSPIKNEIVNGLKHVKYYFPNYKIPTKLITFIGPINSYGNIITTDALAVGLQLYLGKNNTLYQSEAGQQMYPLYISRRFAPEYIPVSAIRNIVDDMYPDNAAGRPLVEQMIEAGKRLYLLDQFLPATADTLKIGYTEAQLEGSYKNEAFIWSFFVQNDLLFSSEPAMTKDYMSEGPKTAVLGDASPGFIGQFIGLQIVKKWVEDREEIGLEKLMATDPKIIFNEAKYKPR